MAQVRLKRLLSKKRGAAPIINDLCNSLDASVRVEDERGQILLGTENSDALDKHPIELEGETLGWVVGGGPHAALITALLTHLAKEEAERKSLANEVLDRYRELNLLYNLSEKLAASLELEAVAQTAIDEASRLIQATGGSVLVVREGSEEIEAIASFGEVFQPQTYLKLDNGLVGEVVLSGEAEIINDVRSVARSIEDQNLDLVSSLVYAPLKTKNRIIGGVILVNEVPVAYTAGDLKLLNTLASQAAPAIENALIYEKTLREAREREEKLQQQIQQMRIELNEVKQDQQVAEITESEYFQRLRSQADNLRSIIDGPEEQTSPLGNSPEKDKYS